MLTAVHEVEGVARALRFYAPTEVATDSQFPFEAGDPFRIEVINHNPASGVVLLPPDYGVECLEVARLRDLEDYRGLEVFEE